MSEFSVSSERAREVERILDEDDTRLGEIWRRHRAGESVAQIAAEYEVTSAPVHAYLGLIRSLRDGELTTSPAVASRHASRIRSWLKKKTLSSALRTALEAQEGALNAVAADVAGREEEDQAAAAVTKRVLSGGQPGSTFTHFRTICGIPLSRLPGRHCSRLGTQHRTPTTEPARKAG